MAGLVDLQREYSAARKRVSKSAKYAADRVPPDTCRYCGRMWKLWAGSKLDGHAACIVDERFKYLARTALVDPRVTYNDVALAIGVSPSVVRSWTFPIKATPSFLRARK